MRALEFETKQRQDQILDEVVVYASGFALAVVAVQAYRRYKRYEKEKRDLRDNPFLRDCRRPPPTTKLEPADKKKACKNPLPTSSGDLGDTHYDVICIGSGAGSLTTAAVLARAGRKVLVLEQHTKLGGCCHTFKEGRFEFDTGVHYVGNMGKTSRSVYYQALEQLSNGQMEWAPMNAAYDELVIGENPETFKRFNIYGGGYHMWKQGLLKHFPDELEAIEKLVQLMQQPSIEIPFGVLKMAPTWFANIFMKLGFILKPVSLFNQYMKKSAHEVIAGITSNVYLQACFNYPFGDYGAPPKQAPFFMAYAINNHYIKQGAFYPKNGPAIIPYYLIRAVKERNGQFYTKANVSQILLRKNKKNVLEAYGVEISSKKGGKIQFTADVIVSGAGVLNTFQRMVPAEITKQACPDMTTAMSKTKPSISYLNLFVGFNATSAELKLPSTNNWVIVSPDFDGVLEQWISYDDPYEALEKMTLPLLFIGFPSAKDANYDYNNSRGSTCVAITLVPYKWFQMWNHLPLGKRGDQYDTLKSAFTDKIWEKIVQLYPQVEDKREVCVLGSPVTSNHYLNTEHGEVYGLDHNIERFSADVMSKIKPKTEIKGLYLTGQDIVTCGVSSAITSGLMTGSQILKRNLMTDLKELYQRINKK
ncbi:all-trans-retinol 13,14-reductase-like isoform X2 [Convolutriloba macropyga]|uniref:all-trans-retinol 13,14-reductase-like isoform X2 n=1 Tax=Convolutriloba macropyga TaxID=536237 RepID=UPI003F526B7A